MRIHIIYLAAGNSRRFGSNKLLTKIRGKEMYRYGLEAAIAACDDHEDWKIYVVSQYQELLSQVKGLYKRNGKVKIETVYSPKSQEGISYSIQAGITASGKTADYYAFLVADQPYLEADTLRTFLEQMQIHQYELGCVSFNGQDGNPACFAKKYADELLALEGDKGGKKVMYRHEEKIWRFMIKAARELVDIDFSSPDLYNGNDFEKRDKE